VSPLARLRLNASVSRQMLAPGAEEFVPPTEGVWLPPERTFSALTGDGRFRPERADHFELGLEHDLSPRDVVGFRTFYQRVDDQLVTLFGVRAPEGNSAELGHYYTGNSGNVDGRGWGMTYRHDVTSRVRGSVDYTVTDAVWIPSGQADLIALWAPSAVRRDHERIHDLTTSVRAEIPETATKVFVLYRINSAYSRADVADEHPGTDARFDVQVNQSLPFLNFTTTEWEALVAVRNLFREPLAAGSVYDELLVVRPPKRIVGGLLVRF
jgi:outer membrane receptor protein involved in Fe transport